MGEAAQRALRKAFKGPRADPRRGQYPDCLGIPRILGVETLLMGLGLPDCRAHSPNENFPLENFEGGIRLNKAILQELAHVALSVVIRMLLACAVLSASDRTTAFESPLRTADTTASSMKWLLILAILFGAVDAAPSAEESLGTKIKKVLEPDPTPTPTRKHRKHSTKKPTPTPSPTASQNERKLRRLHRQRRRRTNQNAKKRLLLQHRESPRNRDSVCESGGITRSWSRKKRLA